MKAMVLDHPSDIRNAPLTLKNLPAPTAGPGQVRVMIRVCGVCRTDLHVVEGELPPAAQPIIPGHEVVGVVDQIGKGVRRVHEGDRVGIAWLQGTCRNCTYCLSGRENLCVHARFTGYHLNGGYAEYALVSEAFAYPIPAQFTDTEVAPTSLRRDYWIPGVTIERN